MEAGGGDAAAEAALSLAWSALEERERKSSPFVLLQERHRRRRAGECVLEAVESAFSAGIDYFLIVGRRYRLRVRDDEDLPRWRGMHLQLRLTFADDGSEVPGPDDHWGALLSFEADDGTPGSEDGESAPVVPLCIGHDGISESFGIAASSQWHANRSFRLVVETAGGGPAIVGIVLRTMTHVSSVGPSRHRARKRLDGGTADGAEGYALPGGPPSVRASWDPADSRESPLPSLPGWAVPRPAPLAPVGWDAPLAPPSTAAAPAAALNLDPTVASSLDLILPPAPLQPPAPLLPPAQPPAALLGSSITAEAPSSIPPLAPPLRPPPSSSPPPVPGGSRHSPPGGALRLPSIPEVPSESAEAAEEAAAAFVAAVAALSIESSEIVGPALAASASASAPASASAAASSASSAAGGATSSTKTPDAPAPRPPPRLGPSYRHADAEARDVALAGVYAAEAAATAAAKAAGLSHPASADDIAGCRAGRAEQWARLQSGLRGLAWALAGAEVLDTDLFRTRDGTLEARRALEDLRLSGSQELMDMVLDTWRLHILRVPDELTKEDAVLLAEHAWGLLQIVCGWDPGADWTLLPVNRDYVLTLLEKVERVLAPYVEESGPDADPALFARTAAARARALEQIGDGEAAAAGYFEAWAALMRAGLAPSRREAAVLQPLVDLLLRMPARADLGAQLCDRLYWFEESDEDRYGQSLALQTLAARHQLRGQLTEAANLLTEALGLVAPLSPGYRTHAWQLHQSLMAISLQRLDLPAAYRHAKRGYALLAESALPSAPDADSTFAATRRARGNVGSAPGGGVTPKGPNPATPAAIAGSDSASPEPPPPGPVVETVQNVVRVLFLLGSETQRAAPLIEGHSLYQAGLAEMAAGAHRRALESLERAARALYRRFPAYFPPQSPRVRQLNMAIGECRARLYPGKALAASAAGGAGPEPLPTEEGRGLFSCTSCGPFL
eukprot:tig00020572_g11545.t1